MFTVYILKNLQSRRYYVGHTGDLQDRIKRHNAGRNRSTRSSGKWVLVRREEYFTKQEAWIREMQIKSNKGGEAFKKLLAQIKDTSKKN